MSRPGRAPPPPEKSEGQAREVGDPRPMVVREVDAELGRRLRFHRRLRVRPHCRLSRRKAHRSRSTLHQLSWVRSFQRLRRCLKAWAEGPEGAAWPHLEARPREALLAGEGRG